MTASALISPLFNLGAALGIDSAISVDALPETGDNQQIVFSRWEGTAASDVESYVTYPPSSWLQSVGGVRAVRATSSLGFSAIHVIFDDDCDFHASRSRVVERLASIPMDLLPPGVEPVLGPEATSTGQVYGYRLVVVDDEGRPAEGWDLDELRSLQDTVLKPHLESVAGVAEVASIGGFVREYQVEASADALRRYELTLADLANAIEAGNEDISGRQLEFNGTAYSIRGLGRVRDLESLGSVLVSYRHGTPILLRDVATVGVGPAPRQGVLDDGGTPSVGAFVVAG